LAKAETAAEAEPEAPVDAAIVQLELGDVLPALTLKNEQGEDLDVAGLTENGDKGVVLFLVPKADTREFYLTRSSHLLFFSFLFFSLYPASVLTLYTAIHLMNQLVAPRKPVYSEIRTRRSPSSGMRSME